MQECSFVTIIRSNHLIKLFKMDQFERSSKHSREWMKIKDSKQFSFNQRILEYAWNVVQKSTRLWVDLQVKVVVFFFFHLLHAASHWMTLMSDEFVMIVDKQMDDDYIWSLVIIVWRWFAKMNAFDVRKRKRKEKWFVRVFAVPHLHQ